MRPELNRRSIDPDADCARSREDARSLRGRFFGLKVAVRLSLDIDLHVRPSYDERLDRASTSRDRSNFGLSGILFVIIKAQSKLLYSVLGCLSAMSESALCCAVVRLRYRSVHEIAGFVLQVFVNKTHNLVRWGMKKVD